MNTPRLRTLLAFVLGTAPLGWALTQTASEPSEPVNWQKTGKDGRACASCHTPSGIEITASDISLDDIKRRSLKHLSYDDTIALVSSIEKARTGHDLRFQAARPLSRKTELLAKGTPQEREELFYQELQRIAPLLCEGTILDLKSAEDAARQLTSTPLDLVAFSLPLDPLSRDPHRQEDGCILGDWIPDAPLSPVGTAAFVKACQENRKADGSYDLLAVQRAIDEADGQPKSNFELWSRYKRLALLELQPWIERGRLPAISKFQPGMSENPVWAIGNLTRLIETSKPSELGMSVDQCTTAGVERDKPLDLKETAVSWMWSGWILDPSLQRTSFDPLAQNGQYLAKLLWKAGPYPWHSAYFAARRPVEASLVVPSERAFQPEINAFVNDGVLLSSAPVSPAYVRFCSNLLAMDMLLLERDLDGGKKLRHASAARQQLTALWTFVKQHLNEEDTKVRNNLFTRVILKIKV